MRKGDGDGDEKGKIGENLPTFLHAVDDGIRVFGFALGGPLFSLFVVSEHMSVRGGIWCHAFTISLAVV